MPRIVLRHTGEFSSVARRPRRRPALLLAGGAIAALLAAAPLLPLVGPVRADVPVENMHFTDKGLEKYAREVGTSVNDCDPVNARKGIEGLKETRRSGAFSFAGGDLAPEDLLKLPDLIALLEREFQGRCGRFELTDGPAGSSFGFFVKSSIDFARQRWDAVIAGARTCDREKFDEAVNAEIRGLNHAAGQLDDAAAGNPQFRAQYARDAASFRRFASLLDKNRDAIYKKYCPESALPAIKAPAPGTTPPGQPPGSTPAPGQPPGAPVVPGQTRPIGYTPNGAPFVAVIEGGAYWHEVRKMLYGIVITNPGVPGSERGNVGSDETITGGSLTLRVSAPGGAIGLSDDWRAAVRLSGQWADGQSSNTVAPGGAQTARRYFFPVPSTGVNYGATGQQASTETDFHRFGFDASLGRSLGSIPIGGGRIDFRGALGISYQYTHVSQELAENNLTFSDIWSTAGFYTTDHLIGPHVAASATYTAGRFRASAKVQFLPGVVFGSGNGYQQNVCGLCPPAEQNFAQSVSASRTAFNARVLFGVDGSYQVLPGLNVGGYFNLNYDSSASSWKFSPNPLKGPPTLRGGEGLGYSVGVKVAVQLR
jgi:hypothetical protein